MRLYAERDQTDFIALFTDAAVMQYVDKGVMSAPAASALWRKLLDEFYPRGKRTVWAVTTIDNGRYIGHAALRPRPEKSGEWEISYMLEKKAWGKGYATEVARRLIAFGFEEMKLKEVFATVDPANKASLNILEKLGLKILKSEFDEVGEFYVCRITKKEWLTKHARRG